MATKEKEGLGLPILTLINGYKRKRRSGFTQSNTVQWLQKVKHVCMMAHMTAQLQPKGDGHQLLSTSVLSTL